MELEEFQRLLEKRDADSASTIVKNAARNKEEYSAFKPCTGPGRMLLFRVASSNKSRPLGASYAVLNGIQTDGRGNGITMAFGNFLKVVVFGHNLQPIFEKLLTHEVEWIEEFDSKLWKEPPQDAPCVLGIEIRRPGEIKSATNPPSFKIQ